MIWSLIDFLYTFVSFFGGEIGDGLFYQVELHADMGLPPDQVTGKKALTGLLFFITLIYNLIWVFAGYMLFKGTETTSPCPVLYRKKLQYCRVWFSASFLLLLVPGINMFIYLTDSLLEIILAMSAFLTRGVFMYLVLKYMLQLQKGPCHTPQVQTVHYTPPPQTSTPRPHPPPPDDNDNDNDSGESTPFNPNKRQQGSNNSSQGRHGSSQNQLQNQGRSPKKSNNIITNGPNSNSPKNCPKPNGSGNKNKQLVITTPTKTKLKPNTNINTTTTITKTTTTATAASSHHIELNMESEMEGIEIEIENEVDGLINSSPNVRVNPMFA